MRENRKEFDGAQINATEVRESDTCQPDEALHANTKELDGAQTNGHDGM